MSRVGMDEHSEASPVDHEPGHKSRKFGDRERYLIHRYCMRSNQPIMPAPEQDGETLPNLLAQDFGGVALFDAVEIDMSVVALDRVERLDCHRLRLTRQSLVHRERWGIAAGRSHHN